MTELVTSGSVGGMASNGCLYPEADAKTYAPSCAFATLIIAQKASPVMAQLSKALWQERQETKACRK